MRFLAIAKKYEGKTGQKGDKNKKAGSRRILHIL